MCSKLAELKKEGKPMPRNVEELEAMVGGLQLGAAGGTAPQVGATALGPRGEPCPLAGTNPGRSTKCPLTRKSYKNCCGKSAQEVP